MYRYLRAQVHDEATAEDLAAQVFIRALVSASSYRGEGSYEAWIFQIVRNTLATWRAHRTRLEIPVGEIPDEPEPEPAPSTIVPALEDRDLILETIEDLPAAQREVVHLRYWKDLSVDEIALTTRRSSGAVRQLLHRARKRLRKRLSGKDLTALLGATGASALAVYSIRRNIRRGR